MRVRFKSNLQEGASFTFNMSAGSEVIVGSDDDLDSVDIKDLDILLPNGIWKDMGQAFKDKDIVPDNLNVRFGYPYDEECKKRGWNQ